MEIQKQDIIKLILQYLKDNGLTKSFNVLSDEANVTLNLMGSPTEFQENIENGSWDRVLREVSGLRLSKLRIMDLYEVIICELMEVNEREVALQLLENLKSLQVAEAFQERYLRLDYIVKKPGNVDKLQLYNDVLDKQQRRQQLARKLNDELTLGAPQSRLLELIGYAVRHQYGPQPLKNVDLFMGLQAEQVEKTDKIVTSIQKVVKYNESMRIEAAAFSHDGNFLVTGSVDGIIEVWDPIARKMRTDLTYQASDQFMLHDRNIIGFEFSKDNEFLASFDAQQVKIWKIFTGKLLKTIENTHGSNLQAVQWNGQDVLVASTEIHVINLKSSAILKMFRGHTGIVNSILVSPQGSQVFTCSEDKTVRVWDYSRAECIFQYQAGYGVISIQRGVVDSKQILVCVRSRELILLNQGMNLVKKFTIPEDIEGEYICSGFSCKGQTVYGFTTSKVLLCFDLTTAALKKHNSIATDMIKFHPKKNMAFGYTGKGELHFL